MSGSAGEKRPHFDQKQNEINPGRGLIKNRGWCGPPPTGKRGKTWTTLWARPHLTLPTYCLPTLILYSIDPGVIRLHQRPYTLLHIQLPAVLLCPLML